MELWHGIKREEISDFSNLLRDHIVALGFVVTNETNR